MVELSALPDRSDRNCEDRILVDCDAKRMRRCGNPRLKSEMWGLLCSGERIRPKLPASQDGSSCLRQRPVRSETSSIMEKLDRRDPFVRLIIKSIVVTAVLIFFVRYVVELAVPGLGRPLFVPFGAALFCGTLGFLAESARKQYALAILEILVATLLFPLLAWLLLMSFHIPYQTREADFIALIPQAIVGISFYHFIRRRFERGRMAQV